MHGQDDGQLTLFREDFPANRSLLQDRAGVRQTTVTSGLNCLELYRNSGPLGSLARMLLGSSAWYSPVKKLEWKAEALTVSRVRTTTRRYGHDRKTCCSWHSSKTLSVLATPSKHLLFRLVPSERDTDGTESPLWPTVTAADWRGRGPNSKQQGLPEAVKMWATPNTMDYLPQRSAQALARQAATTRKGRTRPANLREQVDPETVRMWPTPTVADTFTSKMKSTQQKAGSMHSVNLSDAVQLWPTPSASDRGRQAITPILTKNGTIKHKNRQGGQSQARLDQVAALFATPCARDFRTGQCGRWEERKHTQNLNDQIGGQLNPQWVEWLMGFPAGWTDIG